MEIKQYLKENQSVVYSILKNSFKKNKTSHAYIVSGSKGSPILECAVLMAQSFICENKDQDNLACGECVNCQKIAGHKYADYIYIEGENLKSDATLAIQSEFNKSAIESANIKIYIINLIEKAPVSSLNKLLKFIEEPNSNTIAIFTSNSVSKILPTIVSRCQVITFKEFKTSDLVNYLTDNGVAEDDAWLISKISNNSETNLETINSDAYKDLKGILSKSLEYLAKKDDYFIVYLQLELNCKGLSNKDLELFFDMLEVSLLQAVIKREDENHEVMFFKEQISNIAKNFDHIDKMIEDITKAKIDLLSNANKNLVFDKLLINLLRR